jgi:ATP-binding cassette, subfamily B (MDR/TAP), member 1
MMMLRAASAASEIFATLDTPVPDMSGLKGPDVSAAHDIIFKDVRFAYPTRPDSIILNKLNVRFETGKTTAIVGPSGSGKSTIVGLIQRWYEPGNPDNNEAASLLGSEKEKADGSSNALPDSGYGVYIGPTNLNKIDVKWWRMNVGLVQQEPFLFNDTIYNNVANGLSGTKGNDLPKEEKLEMVKNACKEAYAAEYIARLPDVSNAIQSSLTANVLGI